MNDGDKPAFPQEKETVDKSKIHIWTGISKREYFAGQALPGILANPVFMAQIKEAARNQETPFSSAISVEAYRMADAMFEAQS